MHIYSRSIKLSSFNGNLILSSNAWHYYSFGSSSKLFHLKINITLHYTVLIEIQLMQKNEIFQLESKTRNQHGTLEQKWCPVYNIWITTSISFCIVKFQVFHTDYKIAYLDRILEHANKLLITQSTNFLRENCRATNLVMIVHLALRNSGKFMIWSNFQRWFG